MQVVSVGAFGGEADRVVGAGEGVRGEGEEDEGVGMHGGMVFGDVGDGVLKF